MDDKWLCCYDDNRFDVQGKLFTVLIVGLYPAFHKATALSVSLFTHILDMTRFPKYHGGTYYSVFRNFGKMFICKLGFFYLENKKLK